MKNKSILRLFKIDNINRVIFIFISFYWILFPDVLYAEPLLKKNTVIKSQSATINLEKQFTEFNKGIEIIRSSVIIHSQNLIKRNINQSDSKKTIEEMLLSGNPVSVTINDKSNHRVTMINAFHVRFIPETGFLEIQQDAKLKVIENKKKLSEISAHRIEITLLEDKIKTIIADGESKNRPLIYDLYPENADHIHSLAQHLKISYPEEKAHLFNAKITQGDNRFQAGEITVDSATGNFEANGSESQKPSISIDLKTLQKEIKPKDTGEKLKKSINKLKNNNPHNLGRTE